MKYLMLVAAGLIVTNALSSAQEPPTEWEARNPFPIGDKLSSIIFANGVFVVVDGSGAILTTSDGIDGTQFVVTRKDGTLLHTVDGSDVDSGRTEWLGMARARI